MESKQDNNGIEIYRTNYKIRITLNRKTAKRSEKNPERYIIILDGKELEVVSTEVEYYVDQNGYDLLSDVITSLHRIDGTEGILRITIT